MTYVFGYVGGPPGSPEAVPVVFDTESSSTPHRYYILKARYVDGSEIGRPWTVVLTRSYWPIPVSGVHREDIGGVFQLAAGTSIRVSEAEWLALVFAGGADG